MREKPGQSFGEFFNTFRPAFRKYNKKHEKRKMETKGARNFMIDSVGIMTKTTLL